MTKIIGYEYNKKESLLTLIGPDERFEIDLETFIDIYMDITENEGREC